MIKSHILQNYDLDELEKNINEFLAQDGVKLVTMHVDSVLAPKREFWEQSRIWHTVVILYETLESTSFQEDMMFVLNDMTDAQAEWAIGYLQERLNKTKKE